MYVIVIVLVNVFINVLNGTFVVNLISLVKIIASQSLAAIVLTKYSIYDLQKRINRIE